MTTARPAAAINPTTMAATGPPPTPRSSPAGSTVVVVLGGAVVDVVADGAGTVTEAVPLALGFVDVKVTVHLPGPGRATSVP